MTNGNWVQDPDNPEFWYWVTGEGAVLSVNGKTGEVVLTYADVGAMPDTFTESDPTVPSYVKAISQEDIDNWNAGGSGSGNPVTISETAPEDAGEGDLWFCTLESELGLYCYDGTTWFEVGGSNSSGGGPSPSGDSSGVVISPTEPTDKFEGMLWLNSDTAEVFIFDGAVWLEFPAGSSGSGGGLWEQKGDDIYYADGKVGIGTDVAEAKLHVSGGADTAGFYRNIDVDNVGAALNWIQLGSKKAGVDTPAANFGGLLEPDGLSGSATIGTLSNGTLTERMRIDADGGVNIGNSASVEEYNQLQVTASIAGIMIKGDGDSAFAQQSFKTDEGSWAVGMRPETGSSFVVRNSGSGLIPMTINADGNTVFAGTVTSKGNSIINAAAANTPVNLYLRPTLNYNDASEASITLGPDVGPVANGRTFKWRIASGGGESGHALKFYKTVAPNNDESLGMYLDSSSNLTVNGIIFKNGSTPVAATSDLIKTLVTLRKATMDETQDIRESLRDAIDELVAGFEQEIAAMPAPEPEVSTQEIPE